LTVKRALGIAYRAFAGEGRFFSLPNELSESFFVEEKAFEER
jgi:hypothetical protein